MSRHIDADKLWEEIDNEDIYTDFESARIFKMVREKINNAPTVDVEEVKTAMFVECANDSGYKCSRCKARVKIKDVVNETHKYCYKCGARFVGVIPYRFKEEEK